MMTLPSRVDGSKRRVEREGPTSPCYARAGSRSRGPPVPLQPGYRIERYVIEAPLGRGGMGAVYRARDYVGDASVTIDERIQWHRYGEARAFAEDLRAALEGTLPDEVRRRAREFAGFGSAHVDETVPA